MTRSPAEPLERGASPPGAPHTANPPPELAAASGTPDPGGGAVLTIPLPRRLLLALAPWGVLLGAWLARPAVGHGPVLCPYRLMSGLPCPGCGMTRALTALVHGELARAVHLNALVLPVAALFALYPLVEMGRMARGSPPLTMGSVPRRTTLAVTALVLAYHAVRTATWLVDGTIARDYWPRSIPGVLAAAAHRLLGG